MDARHEVKSLKKALRALTFMNQRGDTSVAEVALAIGVPRPTSYRILETLASEGYVEKQAHSAFYRITSRVQGLAAGFQDLEMLLEVAKPKLARIGSELGWPITLYTPRGKHMVVRLNTDHESALALQRFKIGFAVPMFHATSGYCYLAHCPAAERDAILAHAIENEELPANYLAPGEGRYLIMNGSQSHFTRFNRQRSDEIVFLLKLIGDRGFCNLEFQHYREGNVGVPLLVDGKPVGGLVMRYIKSVMRNTDRIHNVYVPRLRQLALDIVDDYLSPRSTCAPVQTADVIYPKFG